MIDTSPKPAAYQRQAPQLTRSQIVTVCAIGVIFWFVAALCVRFGAPAGLFGGAARLVNFVVIVPAVGWLTVIVAKRAAALQQAQVIPGLAAGIAAATFCDGIALSWARGLYGASAEQVLPGAAWILWGVGWILAAGYIDSVRPVKV